MKSKSNNMSLHATHHLQSKALINASEPDWAKCPHICVWFLLLEPDCLPKTARDRGRDSLEGCDSFAATEALAPSSGIQVRYQSSHQNGWWCREENSASLRDMWKQLSSKPWTAMDYASKRAVPRDEPVECK